MPGVAKIPEVRLVNDGPLPVGTLMNDTQALINRLVEKNPDVLAASARVQQAIAGLAQDRLIPNPGLEAGVSTYPVGDTNPPGLTPGDTTAYTGTLSETIEIGKRGPRIASAQARLESERQSYLDTLAKTTADARYALARVVYLSRRQAVLEESAEAARQNEELQKARLDNGDLSGNDFDRLRVDTMVLESEVAANEEDYQEALSSCAAILLGSCGPGESDLALLDSSATVPAQPDVEEALRSRPDLVSLGFDRSAALEDATLARHRKIPDPNISFGYTYDNLTIAGNQPHTLALGVAIPLPIFDRGQHDATRAEKRADELAYLENADRERGRAEVGALLARKASLEATLARLRDQAVPTSKGVLDSTLSAVNQGGMSMTDLLLARRTHTDLLLKVMDLQFGLFTVRNDLRRTLGLDAGQAPPPPGA
jgi:outer membrane protein, heavy metal efflux system